MAWWIGMEAEKSRTERMLMGNHPTWGWFEATDLSGRTQKAKNIRETRDFYFLTPQCLPIEPLAGLFSKFSPKNSFFELKNSKILPKVSVWHGRKVGVEISIRCSY